jgi:hypothetical protein
VATGRRLFWRNVGAAQRSVDHNSCIRPSSPACSSNKTSSAFATAYPFGASLYTLLLVRDGEAGVSRSFWQSLQFFDQRRSFEIQQARGLSLVAAGSFERAHDEIALDPGNKRVEIHSGVRQCDR